MTNKIKLRKSTTPWVTPSAWQSTDTWEPFVNIPDEKLFISKWDWTSFEVWEAWTPLPTYTVTNNITDRSFDANSVTLHELADILWTLINDVQTWLVWPQWPAGSDAEWWVSSYYFNWDLSDFNWNWAKSVANSALRTNYTSWSANNNKSALYINSFDPTWNDIELKYNSLNNWNIVTIQTPVWLSSSSNVRCNVLTIANSVTAMKGSIHQNNAFNRISFALVDWTFYAVSDDWTTPENTIITWIDLTKNNTFKIVWTVWTNIKFYVNWILKATHTTKMPDITSTSTLYIWSWVETQEAVNKTVYLFHLSNVIDIKI